MKYAKKENGIIRIYDTLPKKYNGIIYFHTASKEVLEKNGFYPLIEPAFDSSQEKLDNLHFDETNKVYTYDVVALTPEEIADFQRQKQLEELDAYIEKWRMDGQSYHDEIRRNITASLVGRTDAMTIMAEINKVVYPLLDKIKAGDWPLAILDYQDNQNNPTIPEVIDWFNAIGQKAIEYYTNEYPH